MYLLNLFYGTMKCVLLIPQSCFIPCFIYWLLTLNCASCEVFVKSWFIWNLLSYFVAILLSSSCTDMCIIHSAKNRSSNYWNGVWQFWYRSTNTMVVSNDKLKSQTTSPNCPKEAESENNKKSQICLTFFFWGGGMYVSTLPLTPKDLHPWANEALLTAFRNIQLN